MKLTRILALAVVMICIGFAASVNCAERAATTQDTAVALTHDSGFELHKQTPTDTAVQAVFHVDAVCELHKDWVKESVGAMPLNVFREPVTVKELDGFRDIAFKPNIANCSARKQTITGFKGIGHDHFARADV